MKRRGTVYTVLAVASFALMAGSLVLAYTNAPEGGVGVRELAPSFGFALFFLVNVVLAKRHERE